MVSYNLHQTHVDILEDDGTSRRIFFNEKTGNAFYRLKIDTLFHVKHTGIYIGRDLMGEEYFMHNHFHVGKPSIAARQEFSKGYNLHFYRTPITQPLTVIENGLNEILRAESYHSTNYNCQTFVNFAMGFGRSSEDVEKIFGRVVVGALLCLALIAIAKN